jgi:hypothetical protein
MAALPIYVHVPHFMRTRWGSLASVGGLLLAAPSRRDQDPILAGGATGGATFRRALAFVAVGAPLMALAVESSIHPFVPVGPGGG